MTGDPSYWQRRATEAEFRVKELEKQLVQIATARFPPPRAVVSHCPRCHGMSWELENHRQEAQKRRDREIGEMGGGG